VTQVFVFDFRFDLPTEEDTKRVNVAVCHKDARIEAVRHEYTHAANLIEWGTLTVRDKGNPAETKCLKTVLIVRAKENGYAILPADAGRFIGSFATNWTTRWLVFEVRAPAPDAPVRGKTGESRASPAPPSGNGSCPSTEEPPPPETEVPWF